MTAPAVPTGATMLTPDEAVRVILTGDHPEVDCGDDAMDHLLILMIRAEVVRVARFDDQRLYFLSDQTKVRELAADLGVDLNWTR